jgi:transposase
MIMSNRSTRYAPEQRLEIIKKVKELRNSMSLEQAAKQAGVTVSTYYAWTTPTKKTVAKNIKVMTYSGATKQTRKYTKSTKTVTTTRPFVVFGTATELVEFCRSINVVGA